MLSYYRAKQANTKLHRRWSGMTEKRDDGSEGGMAGRRREEAEINAAKAWPVQGS